MHLLRRVLPDEADGVPFEHQAAERERFGHRPVAVHLPLAHLEARLQELRELRVDRKALRHARDRLADAPDELTTAGFIWALPDIEERFWEHLTINYSLNCSLVLLQN